MFNHDPPTGVNNGMTPCENSHRINAVDLCPAKWSRTNSTRNAGNSAGRVIGWDNPACHRSQVARDTSAVGGGSGNVARMAVNSRSSHGCRTAFGQVVVPSTRTRPSAGWNRVRTLAVPLRMYSWG